MYLGTWREWTAITIYVVLFYALACIKPLEASEQTQNCRVQETKCEQSANNNSEIRGLPVSGSSEEAEKNPEQKQDCPSAEFICGIAIPWMRAFFVKAITDPITFFTFVLAVVGWLQWRVYRRQADTLPRLERAYIFVQVIMLEEFRSTPSGFPNRVRIRFENHGKTPAIIKKIRAYAPILERVPQELLQFPGSDAEIPDGLVIKAGGPFDHDITCTITDDNWTDIYFDRVTAFFVGKIEYDDIFGKRRETGFCWRLQYHLNHSVVIISPNTKLNYYT